MPESFLSGNVPIRLDVHEAAHTPSPAPAIVLLHGSGGNSGRWIDRFAPQLTAAGVSLFAPHYFDRTATTRATLATITDGVHVPLWLSTLDDTLRLIAARPNVDPTRIALVGVSLGGFLALAYAATCSASPDPAVRSRIRAIVELAGGLIEPYASQATPSFPPTLILHGAADSIVPVTYAQDLTATLTRLGVDHRTRILPHEDHWFSAPKTQLDLLLAVSTFLSQHLHP